MIFMQNEFLSKVFRWFSLGLLVTFLTAYITSTNYYLLSLIFSGIGYAIGVCDARASCRTSNGVLQ